MLRKVNNYERRRLQRRNKLIKQVPLKCIL